MRRTGEVRRLVSLETVPCGAAIENSHFSPVCSGLLAAVPLGRARRAPRIIRIVGSVLGRDRSRLRPEILLVDDSHFVRQKHHESRRSVFGGSRDQGESLGHLAFVDIVDRASRLVRSLSVVKFD